MNHDIRLTLESMTSGMLDIRWLLLLTVPLSADIWKQIYNGRFLMFDPCAQSAYMFHPEDWNLIKSTQHTQDCFNCCLQMDILSSLADCWRNGSSGERGSDNGFQTCSHPPREWGRVWGFQLRYHELLLYSSGSPQLQMGPTINTWCTIKLGCDFSKKLHLLLLKVTLTL